MYRAGRKLFGFAGLRYTIPRSSFPSILDLRLSYVASPLSL